MKQAQQWSQQWSQQWNFAATQQWNFASLRNRLATLSRHQPLGAFSSKWAFTAATHLGLPSLIPSRSPSPSVSPTLAVSMLREPSVQVPLAIAVLMFAALVRCCVALHPYSGYATPPMYGDYEAQRHWMEITVNLPVQEWYTNTRNNDLQYWGLDYPPLTAYFSWAWGKLAQVVQPDMVKLWSSRGYETVASKLFMRMSVLVSDIVVFFPAALVWSRSYHSSRTLGGTEQGDRFLVSLALILLQPALVLTDHGHFQYNCVSLGLALWAAALSLTHRNVLASIAFVLSLNYKQMSLYYAPAFFFLLLGRCFATSSTRGRCVSGILRVALLGVVVLSVFAMCWAPFLSDTATALQVVRRIFPVGRGIFEDKVANLWCALSPVVKLKAIVSQGAMAKISALATLVALAPIALPLMRRGIKQVHEKSILLPLLPLTLLAQDYPTVSLFGNMLASFSMYPLFLKDDVVLPYFVLTFSYVGLFLWLVGSRRKFWVIVVSVLMLLTHLNDRLHLD
eukprot:m51a1_g771 hypothetical protein (508) ;mRNA; r:576901-579065